MAGRVPAICASTVGGWMAGTRPAMTVRTCDPPVPTYLRFAVANEGTDTRLIQAFLGHRDIRHTAHDTAIVPKRLAGVRGRSGDGGASRPAPRLCIQLSSPRAG